MGLIRPWIHERARLFWLLGLMLAVGCSFMVYVTCNGLVYLKSLATSACCELTPAKFKFSY